MRVTYVVNDASTGGAQTLVEGLAHRLGTRVNVSIVVLLAEGPLSPRLERVSDTTTYVGLDRRMRNPLKVVRAASRAISATRPDVVHSHLLQSDFVAASSKMPSSVSRVSTIHTTGMTAEDPLASRVLGRLMGPLSHRFDEVVACTDGSVKYMRQMRYPKETGIVIRNGVTISSAVEPRPRSGSLLCLSRWHPMKDHGTLFESLALARSRGYESTLRCAGSGMTDENEDLLSLIRHHSVSDQVELLGPVDDVEPLIDQADAIVISSRYGEALPMAGLEALAQGTPVVTTDVGDSKLLSLAPQFLVRPQDTAALSNSLLYLSRLSDVEYRALSLSARRRAETYFSIEATADEYLKLYNRLQGEVARA